MDHDTIVAIATAPGFGAIGIVKISGPFAFDISRRFFQRPNGKPVPPRHGNRIVYGRILDPATGDLIDEVLVSFMRGPATYTGEDVVEVNAHGGPVVLQTILALSLAHGARNARPGEFTLRAFLNGRIDLTRAEAIADIIHAKTQAALKQAARQIDGHLELRIQGLRAYLEDLGLKVAAAIDFPDEMDVPSEILFDIEALERDVYLPLRELLADYERTQVLKEGRRIGIVGPPNVGKSSLMNRLLKKDRVIVTDIPGTTRDVIEDEVQIGGVPIALIDTAGLRETTDPIERLGIENTRRACRSADLVLCLFDGSTDDFSFAPALLSGLENAGILCLVNKVDLVPKRDRLSAQAGTLPSPVIYISAKTGEGIASLEAAVAHRLRLDDSWKSAADGITSLRQRNELCAAERSIVSVMNGIRSGQPAEIIAIDLKEAIDRLNAVVGINPSTDVLDRIFERFCVGK